VASFVVPRNLIDSALDELEPDRRDWIAALPGIVGALAQRWSLRLDAPFQPGGRCSWVAAARDLEGRDLVVKVG
jgi:streptomycin 6-kinase